MALTTGYLVDHTRIGLEFKGGYELNFAVAALKAGDTLTSEQVLQAANILSERANKLGMSEPQVNILGRARFGRSGGRHGRRSFDRNAARPGRASGAADGEILALGRRRARKRGPVQYAEGRGDRGSASSSCSSSSCIAGLDWSRSSR